MSTVPSTVGDVMTRDVVALRAGARFKDIVSTMRARAVSAFPVLDANDRVVGVVSEDDLLVREGFRGQERLRTFRLRHSDRAKAAGLSAADLMTRPAITIRPEATLAAAARTMHGRHVKRLPVVAADGHLLGIVSRTDLLGVYDRPDADIRGEILKRVIGDAFVLDPLAFQVAVSDGLVTLAGPVEDEQVAASLVAAVRLVDGVVAVRNRLRYPDYPRSPR
jgi:CBS-domain-containing membrane protein